jgi:predicted metal-dependent hydrolase
MRADGTARVTVPRGGSAAAAREFVGRNLAWLERQWQQMQARSRHPAAWHIGSMVLLRGELSPIQPGEPGFFCFNNENFSLAEPGANLRPAIEKYLRKLAAQELPARLAELAGQHGFTVKRVTVRNQRTRWGSCSQRSGISLNWRLIQTPDFVRDYIILHELAHLRQMNHSNRFWHEVEGLCPEYEVAERWLKTHRDLLRDI